MTTSQPTRTAQSWSTGGVTEPGAGVTDPGANAPAPPDPGPTEVLSLAPEDGAAISFARERARVLERLDHSASVRRLLRALYVGLSLWFTVTLLDLYVTQVTGEGDLVVFCWSRILGSLVLLGILWRLRRAPEPAPLALALMDAASFTAAAISIGATSLAYRGLESPYAPGVVVILLARGAMLLGPWKQGIWMFAAPALTWPIMATVAAQFDPKIAAQFSNPQAIASFATTLFMLFPSYVLCVMGGHFAWQLRREAVETRNIGRYKLERRLGGGGMGEVWAAFDVTLRQRVALKTVSGHRPGSPHLARLEREVRALAELTHPNTVRVFDYGVTDDGLWYYAMELLHGSNLGELVEREGPLPVERLLPIARQVLRALGEAHDKGIIHRDIKPENVFVAQLGGESDVVKLLDFGIARGHDDTKLTNTGFVAGTPAYMAPETILGQPADVRSDIYSFGVLLYNALTAALPFRDENTMALFAAHVSRPLVPLSERSPRPLPPALVSIVERCLAKDPSQRFPSTQALLTALEPLSRAPTS